MLTSSSLIHLGKYARIKKGKYKGKECVIVGFLGKGLYEVLINNRDNYNRKTISVKLSNLEERKTETKYKYIPLE
jgi:ribosomal protein L14E/L6E/L27E